MVNTINHDHSPNKINNQNIFKNTKISNKTIQKERTNTPKNLEENKFLNLNISNANASFYNDKNKYHNNKLINPNHKIQGNNANMERFFIK